MYTFYLGSTQKRTEKSTQACCRQRTNENRERKETGQENTKDHSTWSERQSSKQMNTEI